MIVAPLTQGAAFINFEKKPLALRSEGVGEEAQSVGTICALFTSLLETRRSNLTGLQALSLLYDNTPAHQFYQI